MSTSCPHKSTLYLPHRAIANSYPPQSNKLGLKEKVKQGVRALEWNGDELFCGFELGRVIRMKINIYDGTMSTLTFPESYGSRVTQLSCKGNSLLVSTVERTWMVDTETHKLEQVSIFYMASSVFKAWGLCDVRTPGSRSLCVHYKQY